MRLASCQSLTGRRQSATVPVKPASASDLRYRIPKVGQGEVQTGGSARPNQESRLTLLASSNPTQAAQSLPLNPTLADFLQLDDLNLVVAAPSNDTMLTVAYDVIDRGVELAMNWENQNKSINRLTYELMGACGLDESTLTNSTLSCIIATCRRTINAVALHSNVADQAVSNSDLNPTQ